MQTLGLVGEKGIKMHNRGSFSSYFVAKSMFKTQTRLLLNGNSILIIQFT